LANRATFAEEKGTKKKATTPWLGVLLGLVFTALVQSSSVTTGLAIILVQQGVLPPQAAIPIVIGANVGSTSTALIASLTMSATARASAIAGLLFNAAGLLLFFPFITPFSRWVITEFERPGQAVAAAHLIFNLTIGLLFLLMLNRLEPYLAAWLRPRERNHSAAQN
jgi:Na+/phosphate symporter